jgi:hypothetical protein
LCWWTLQDYRRGLRLALLGVGTAAVGFAVCGLVFGQAFFHGLLLPRHYDLTRLGSIGRLQFIAPALIIAAVWAAYRRRNPAASSYRSSWSWLSFPMSDRSSPTE